MSNLTLIVPAAGRGSRFSKNGIITPKPLIDLMGRPFFWWATESVRRFLPVTELIFVILEEHIRSHNIDQVILSYYPDAKLVAIPDITKGAAETALIGIQAMSQHGAIAINDCDHAFKIKDTAAIKAFLSSDASSALVSFISNNPAYSYAKLNEQHQVIGTVEKEVVSQYAIAGCYFFNDSRLYEKAYLNYINHCSYNEYFVSGIYNELANEKESIKLFELSHHCAFGTPPEYEAAQETIQSYAYWIDEQ